MKVATWTGAAGTNEWDRAENWYEKIVPSNGDSIRIAAMKERPAPAVPADFLATDFYVAGSMAGGPITVAGEFKWESGHVSAYLDLKANGNILTEESLKLSGTIRCAQNLIIEGTNQVLLDSGQIFCAKKTVFTNSGLRGISGAPSRFYSLNYSIKGSSRFSGRGLVVERASGGLFYIEGELDVDEGAKLLWNKGAVGGMGFLNIIYDATMESEVSDSTGAGCGWWEISPDNTTARFRLLD